MVKSDPIADKLYEEVETWSGPMEIKMSSVVRYRNEVISLRSRMRSKIASIKKRTHMKISSHEKKIHELEEWIDKKNAYTRHARYALRPHLNRKGEPIPECAEECGREACDECAHCTKSLCDVCIVSDCDTGSVLCKSCSVVCITCGDYFLPEETNKVINGKECVECHNM